MSEHKVSKSPVFPAGKQWTPARRKGVYESNATALIRSLLQDDAVREDQQRAWERWRNDPAGLKR